MKFEQHVKNDRVERANKALKNFNGKIFGEHNPEYLWCGCADGREEGGHHLGLDGHTLLAAVPGAAFPYYKDLDELDGTISLAALKGVSVIFVNGHSDCAAAKAGIAYPDPSLAPDDKIEHIIKGLLHAGVDLPRLKESLELVCEHNSMNAANLLARHMALNSVDHISMYPGVEDALMRDRLDLIPVFHDLRAGTGLPSRMERYDSGRQTWVDVTADPLTNMCERPHHCLGCKGCHVSIEDSLNWVHIPAWTADGQTTMAEVPVHIAGLLKEFPEMYQPKLYRDMQARGEVRSVYVRQSAPLKKAV